MRVILSIAGSDSGGGAGIQADIKTAEAFGLFATTALSAVTAQNTLGVSAVAPISAEFLLKQIEAVLSDFDVAAIKIGMLGSKAAANAVKPILREFKNPIVLDPVAISRAGSKLLDDEAKAALEELFPLSTLVTPNHFEAEYFGLLCDKTARLPNANFLIKNVASDTDKAIDRLFLGGVYERDFETLFAQKSNTHGTGCTYSTAIACGLALGLELQSAIEKAKNYIYQAIKNAPDLGRGNGPIRHKF